MLQTPETSAEDQKGLGAWLIVALATACGITVANLYYAQPLIGPISESFGIGLSSAGLIVSVLQLGYVLGLLLLAPLGDFFENKSVILLTLCGVVASLLVSIAASNAVIFIAASFLLGAATVATQMIVPLAAHMSPERIRGRSVGTVMSGLLIGILMARPVSTLIGGEFGWRVMYLISAAVMCALILLMALSIPRRRPEHTLTYFTLLRSLLEILVTTPVLRRRGTYQAFFFGLFTMFWTGIPVVLQAPPFSLGHFALSAFMLSGVSGAFIAPLAGHLADRRHGRAMTATAILLAGASFALTWLGGDGNIWLLVIAGILLDAACQTHFVTGQRAIYALSAPIRSRLNALYLSFAFLGGILGSGVSSFAISRGGVALFCATGIGAALVVMLLFVRDEISRTA